MSRLPIVLLLGTLLACTSCSGSSEEASQGAAGATTASIVNANCPMTGEAVDPKGDTTSFQGHTIGFCCGKCIAKFDAMSDADKIAALAKHGTKLN